MDLLQILQGVGKLIEDKFLQLVVLIIVSLIYSQARKMAHRIRYIEINSYATNFALEHSLGNGFAESRKGKLNELLEREHFVTDKD